MTAIWQDDGSGWRLLVPTGFPDERTLHDLVDETPQILPLAGDPKLVVVGKEVPIGNGYADLLAELVPLMESRGYDAADARALLGG